MLSHSFTRRLPSLVQFSSVSRTFSISLRHPSTSHSSLRPSSSAPQSSSTLSSPCIVVLFGWLGGSSHNVSKYADIYLSFGCSVVTFLPNPLLSLLPGHSDKQFSLLQDLLQQTHQQFSHSNSVSPSYHFHLMSNMGAYNYALFINFIRRQANNYHSNTNSPCLFIPRTSHTIAECHFIRSISGVTFDSSPSELTPSVFARGYTGFLTGLFTHSALYHHQIFSPPLSAFAHLLQIIPYFSSRISLLHQVLYSAQPSQASQLYVHSQADPLIPAEQVKKFALANTNRGEQFTSGEFIQGKFPEGWKDKQEKQIEYNPLFSSLSSSPVSCYPPVFFYDFVDSDHVAHFRAHPQPYKSLVAQFLVYSRQSWLIWREQKLV
jgi:hypothetical protein